MYVRHALLGVSSQHRHCIHLVALALVIAGEECEWNQSYLHASVLECKTQLKGDFYGYTRRALSRLRQSAKYSVKDAPTHTSNEYGLTITQYPCLLI